MKQKFPQRIWSRNIQGKLPSYSHYLAKTILILESRIDTDAVRKMNLRICCILIYKYSGSLVVWNYRQTDFVYYEILPCPLLYFGKLTSKLRQKIRTTVIMNWQKFFLSRRLPEVLTVSLKFWHMSNRICNCAGS